MSLTAKVKDLADAIKKTREYNELKRACFVIDNNPALKKKAEDIEKKQQEILLSNTHDEKMKSKILGINEELKKLSFIPEYNSYLIAGKNFSDMMSKLYKTLNDSIKSDLKNSKM